jgi:hypothetical protein
MPVTTALVISPVPIKPKFMFEIYTLLIKKKDQLKKAGL